MATMEGTTSRTDSPSMPLIAVGGRATAVHQAAATTTMTLTEVPTEQSTGTGEILRLTLRARPTVRWDENVEDNEGMGRKSSKRCCIFHKQREFGESSTDSSADEHNDSDENTSSSDDTKPKATNHQRRKIARPKKKSNDVPDYQRFHA
jgi:protein phosphatase 1 regulatory subunit 11